MIVEDSGREVVGLHAHIGSGIDSVEPLLASARRLIEIAPGFEHLRWINFGGGIGVPYRPGEREFPIAEYGRGLARIAGDDLRERGLTAILEPGRYVVASSGTLLSRVTTKKVSAGAGWIGCDTGFNHLVRPSKYGAYHHIVNASRGSNASLRETFDASKMAEDLVVAGNLCESGDVFTRDADGNPITRRLDRTNVGDLIAFCDAGAYGFSMASHYNARLLPPEVLIVDGEVRPIRAAPVVRRPDSRDGMKRLLLPLALLVASCATVPGKPMLDLKIINGRILDGTGAPWFRGDIGVRGNTIVAIGDLAASPAATTIDAHNQIVSPGFIDLLGQSQGAVLEDPQLEAKVRQGVTTEVTGEGFSPGPEGRRTHRASARGRRSARISTRSIVRAPRSTSRCSSVRRTLARS